MSRRTVAVVTGSRAEFGLLVPVMRAIDTEPRLRLRTIVAGSHFVAGTWPDVEAGGFRVDAKVRMQRSGKVGRNADVQAVAHGVAGFGRAFERIRPDVVLVLGDRIEAYAAATAASVGGLRLAHIHGGDRAEGVADEAMRHAISKLAHLHFTATRTSRIRLVRMGEVASLVFNTGSPAIDGLREVSPHPAPPTFIVMQHPVGNPSRVEAAHFTHTLDATLHHAARLDGDVAVFAPNGDPGCEGIRAVIERREVPVIEHLPRSEFLSILIGCRAIIGNSSAGLIEAAALRVPCVNIGPRQAGRERPRNVIDCDHRYASVSDAIARALRMSRSRLSHPYGDGRTGPRIAELLATLQLDHIPLKKHNAY